MKVHSSVGRPLREIGLRCAAIAWTLVFVAACSPPPVGNDASGLLCIPGQSVACACPGGTPGAQSCREDGRGYGLCACGVDSGVDTGLDTGVDGAVDIDATDDADARIADDGDAQGGDDGDAPLADGGDVPDADGGDARFVDPDVACNGCFLGSSCQTEVSADQCGFNSACVRCPQPADTSCAGAACVAGRCGFANAPEGTACPSGVCQSGSCVPCGMPGQPCCAATPACAATDASGRTLECDPSSRLCAPCGEIGLRACAGTTCRSGLACAGACVNPAADAANCGGCGVACSAGRICAGGRCGAALDLLLMVDNSNSMRDNQTNILQQLGSMITALTTSTCTSPSNPTPHPCTSDPTDVLQSLPVDDMHVGVVSSDLGTPGTTVPGCANTDLGDDGMLNPIRYGGALARHEPWTTAPSTYGRPTDCTDPNQYPSFLTFVSSTATTTFTHDFQCNAGLYVNGCGLESQLDSVYRALIIHDASDTPGNASPNAGFLREGALLAIVVVTDEEDGSVRDCRFANGTPCTGSGAIDVYNSVSSAWASADLNLRFYMYQPCGPQDPTWPLSRYIDPSNASTGLLGLKPGHPERVLFAAIAGVPLILPRTGSGSDTHIDWNGLLGTPSSAGPDDFCGRDSSGLAAMTSSEGPISMCQANPDPACSSRVVPACRRAGTTYNPAACTTDVQYFAWPSRRIVEVARRFDESPLCGGSRCNNGLVTSVCGSEYAGAIGEIVTRIQGRLGR